MTDPAPPPVAPAASTQRDAHTEAAGGVPPAFALQLRFEQFQQVATMAVAGAGGALILVQGGYVESTARSGGAVVAFVLAASAAMIGQDKLVEAVEAGRGRTRTVRLLLALAFALLGAGVGTVASLVL